MAKAKPTTNASVIYVTVTPEQKARYDFAATAAGMSMREFAINALDAAVAQQGSLRSDLQLELLGGSDTGASGRDVEISAMRQGLVSQNIRIGKLEKMIEELQKRESAVMEASTQLEGVARAMTDFHRQFPTLQAMADRLDKMNSDVGARHSEIAADEKLLGVIEAHQKAIQVLEKNVERLSLKVGRSK